MEQKMNQEIRRYRTSMFMGLNLRQCLCSAMAIAVSVWIYLRFQNNLGQETVSWLCILAAAPFALAGFFTWHGLPAEKALLIILKDSLSPRILIWKSVNYARLANERRLEAYDKEVYNRGTEHTEEPAVPAEGAAEDSQNGAGQHSHYGNL